MWLKSYALVRWRGRVTLERGTINVALMLQNGLDRGINYRHGTLVDNSRSMDINGLAYLLMEKG